MKGLSPLPALKGYRRPREIISYAEWAYYRFVLSTAMSKACLRSAVDGQP
jgi:putative transposase